jgi:hypothetical protein
MRTAGWYHSNYCPERPFQKLSKSERDDLHDRRRLRAEVASHFASRAARTHDWARCDVTDCERCEYVEAHLDDADDRFPA